MAGQSQRIFPSSTGCTSMNHSVDCVTSARQTQCTLSKLKKLKTFVSVQHWSILQKNYVGKLGEIKYLDFKSNPETQQDYINNRISEATNGLIPDLVSGLDSDTLSVIVSAIYYEREWHKDLNFRYLPPSLTRNGDRFLFCIFLLVIL